MKIEVATKFDLKQTIVCLTNEVDETLLELEFYFTRVKTCVIDINERVFRSCFLTLDHLSKIHRE